MSVPRTAMVVSQKRLDEVRTRRAQNVDKV
jgi:hypothetical protein